MDIHIHFKMNLLEDSLACLQLSLKTVTKSILLAVGIIFFFFYYLSNWIFWQGGYLPECSWCNFNLNSRTIQWEKYHTNMILKMTESHSLAGTRLSRPGADRACSGSASSLWVTPSSWLDPQRKRQISLLIPSWWEAHLSSHDMSFSLRCSLHLSVRLRGSKHCGKIYGLGNLKWG